MTQPLGTRGFNHLLIAALAELELHCLTLQYFGNANSDPDFLICVAAQWALPTSGMFLALPAIFKPRHGCGMTPTWGWSA